MRNAINNVLDSIVTKIDHPEDLATYIESATERNFPPPNLTWMLIALFSFHARMKWAWDVLQPHLSADAESDSSVGVIDLEAWGIIRGHQEWEYSIEGSCGFVRNRVTGETIAINLLEGPEWIWAFAFFRWIDDSSTPVARRLTELHPSGEGARAVIDVLVETGLLHQVDDEAVVICGQHRHNEAAIEQLTDLLSDQDQLLWIAALLGDWHLILKVGDERRNHEGISDWLEHRVTECRDKWIEYLENLAYFNGMNACILYALADACDPKGSDYIKLALSLGFGAVISIIEDDASWCTFVYDHLDGLKYSKASCASYLVRHEYRKEEVIERLAQGDHPDLGKVLELTIDYAPALLHRYVGRALRSSRWSDRLTAAAILALLDDEWSRSQLIDVLDALAERDATIECRAALRESTDHDVRIVPDWWEEKHPEADSDRMPLESLGINPDRNCELLLRERMSELFESVMQMRESMSRS